MKSTALTILLILSWALVCGAQSQPPGKCSFADDGFALTPGQTVEIAEVAARGAVRLELCGYGKGCIAIPAAWGTPVQIYRQQGGWTCGYFSGRTGAGPAWIRSDALREVHYDRNPPLKAWVGTWAGGEDRVLIRAGSTPGTLELTGSAEWSGQSTSHFGDMKGIASPVGNHLHFVEDGPNSCTIDMTMLDHYILASDNIDCGALNARFQGIWRRTGR